jgi:hypothetical protein
MSRTLLVHLLLECSRADPVREFIAQTNKKPSLIEPKDARYLESGLNRTHLMPNVCSGKIVRGRSGNASSAVEKMRTRGLNPVSPMAKNLPFPLKETQVAALIRSLAVHDFSYPSPAPAGFATANCPIPESLRDAAVRLRISGEVPMVGGREAEGIEELREFADG